MRIGDSLIRDIVTRFDAIGDRFDLIAWIDHEIIHKNVAIDRAISNIVERSAQIFSSKKATAFAISGSVILPFPCSDTSSDIELTSDLRNQLIACTKVCHYGAREAELTWLMLPVSVDRISSLKIVLVYESTWYGGQTARLYDPDLLEFANMLVRQCQIMMSARINGDLENARKEIMDNFFLLRLKDELCWFELTQKFSKFLPTWAPLKIAPMPQVQVLTYDGDGESIELRAGTDQDKAAPPKTLMIRETVCGVVISKEVHGVKSADILYIDPTEEHTDRFRAYLYDSPPRTELVIPILTVNSQSSTQIVGLVNIEHPEKRIFLDCHVDILKIAVEFITPFVIALIEEEEEERKKSVAHLYTMHNILTKMAKTYHHKVGQYITASSLSLEAIETLAARMSDQEKVFFDRLKRSVSSFSELSRTFVSGLPNYVQFGRTRLVPLIQGAVNEFDPGEMEQAEDIELKLVVAVKGDVDVFGSPLIAEHVYNIISNSVAAVRQRISAGSISKGSITVTIDQIDQTDRLNAVDSFPLLKVEVKDNGGGLSPDSESKWGIPSYTTKREQGGSGYGVPSTIDYVTAMGGKVEKVNEYPNSLIVQLFFPKYVRAIHERQSGLLNFGEHAKRVGEM